MTGPQTQLDTVVRLVREVLGDDLIGAYPHGSTATGRLQPTSDLDVLAVVRRALPGAARQRLVDGLLAMSGGWPPNPLRPVELTVVVVSDVRPWRYPPRCELLYGEWLREDIERGAPPIAGSNPDLAPLITMVLQGGRALFGPPPAQVLDPVPDADLRRAMVDGLPGLLADLEPDTRNVLLTFARIWTTLATGEIRSKDAAADWALERLPQAHRPVLALARSMYLAEAPDGGWADRMLEVQAHVDHVLAEIGVLAGGSGDPGGS